MAVPLKKGESVRVFRNKLVLLAVSKDEGKEIYKFQKQQEFLPSLFEILLKIGFDKENINLRYFFGISKSDNEQIADDYYEDAFSREYLKIDNFREALVNIEDEKFDVEAIFFNSVNYLIVRKKGKNKLDVGKVISEYCIFKDESV